MGGHRSATYHVKEDGIGVEGGDGLLLLGRHVGGWVVVQVRRGEERGERSSGYEVGSGMCVEHDFGEDGRRLAWVLYRF